MMLGWMVALVGVVVGAWVYWDRVEASMCMILGRALTKKLGVAVSIGKVTTRWTRFAAEDVKVGQKPGPEPWTTPIFASFESIEVTTASLRATLSLLGVVRHGDFCCGFLRRDIATLDAHGIRIHVEEQKTDQGDVVRNTAFLTEHAHAQRAKKRASIHARHAADRAWRATWLETDAADSRPPPCVYGGSPSCGEEDQGFETLEDDEDDEDAEDTVDVSSLKARYEAALNVMRGTKELSWKERAQALLEHRRRVAEQLQTNTTLAKMEKDRSQEKSKQRVRIGRLTVADLHVDLLGHSMTLVNEYKLTAYDGTQEDLVHKLGKNILAAMLNDTTHDMREKARENLKHKVTDKLNFVKSKFSKNGAAKVES